MSIESQLIDRKRFPRLLLAHSDELYTSIQGLYLLWPRGGKSEVLDISYSGLVVEAKGFLDLVKLGDFLEMHLLLPTPDNQRIPLSLRLVRKTARVLGFKIDSISPDGRIQLPQSLKDYLVAKNLRSISPSHLAQQLRPDEWYHGPFDTNFFIWTGNGESSKIIVEYDNQVLVIEGDKHFVSRSASTTDEAAGYVGPFLTKAFGEHKLALGKSWVERLSKILSEHSFQTENLKNLKSQIESMGSK